MARLDDFCKSDRPVELDQWFTFFAFDAVGEVIFTKSFDFLEHADWGSGRLLTFLTRCIAAIDARKQNPAKRNGMMQKWLDTRAKYPDRMEEIEIFATAVRTLGAGGETVSATIQALFYFLIRHPQYMVRLQDELDAAEARWQLLPIVQYAEAQKLPFLQACMKETYRFHAAVGLGLHESPLPVELLLPADSSQKG
ncbi:hypothetical protein N7475_000193 [Penicillium sp. IBT 31633x]|nr:hypothetical protein N7475_000193 [Penicillium sp. IBT 31633x]